MLNNLLAGPQKSGDGQIIIARGGNSGETVVTAGVHMLHAGQKVRTVGAAAAEQGGQP